MKFSVLLSVYKKESPSFLSQCFDSILQQTVLADEVVLVKDGPLPDELENVINKYQEKMSILKIVNLTENQGLGAALNIGMKYCSFDLIARMDTDDIARVDRFERQLDFFLNNPEIDVVGSWVSEFENEISCIKSIRKLPEMHEDIVRFAKLRNPINHPVVMFKKEAVINAGGYHHLPFFEDYYLWVRMLAIGAKFHNIQDSLLYFRFSPDMFGRRGGWKYAVYELNFLGKLRRMGFISKFEYIRNLLMRFGVRIVPNNIRTNIYKGILRKV